MKNSNELTTAQASWRIAVIWKAVERASDAHLEALARLNESRERSPLLLADPEAKKAVEETKRVWDEAIKAYDKAVALRKAKGQYKPITNKECPKCGWMSNYEQDCPNGCGRLKQK